MKKLLLILCVASAIGVNAQTNRAITPNDDTKKAVPTAARQKPTPTKESIELNKKRDQAGILSDTRFLCVKGDWTSPMPGVCPAHKIDLKKDTDPTLVEQMSQASVDDKDFGKNMQRAEDNRYTCLGGDISYLAPGKCPNHPDLELISDKDPKKMALRNEILKNNPETFKNLVLVESILYMCTHSDYSSYTSGKCPNHNEELMLSTSKEFKDKMAANSLKNAAPAKTK
jgi:hypothetical protein